MEINNHNATSRGRQLQFEEDNPYQDEELLLKQIDKDDHDSDNYPCLLLKNATVYSRDGKHLANLLHCATEGPFTIRGVLSIPKKHKNLQLVMCNAEPIQINDCTEFSFDGEPKLWARGLAGWFELKPAEEYKSTFQCMVQAIDLYNVLLDIHDTHEKPKNRYNKDITFIFPKYTEIQPEYNSLPACLNKAQFSQFMLAHATFLISQMCRQTCFVDWPKTTIYAWLTTQRPELHANYLRESTSDRIHRHAKQPIMTNLKSPISARAWSLSDFNDNDEDPFYQADNIGNATRGKLSKTKMNLPKPSQSSPNCRQDDNSITPRSSKGGKGAGKKALARTPAKRSHEDMEDAIEPASAQLSTLRQPTYQPSPLAKQNFLEDEDEDDEEEEEDDDEDTYGDAPEHSFQDSSLPLLSLDPTSTSLPSAKATGPNNSWICREEDCGFEVPAANRSKGREAVTKHIYEHASEEEKMTMLVEEMGTSRNLPVGNLLAMVRRHGEEVRAQQEMQLINGRAAPVPIKRKLLR